MLKKSGHHRCHAESRRKLDKLVDFDAPRQSMICSICAAIIAANISFQPKRYINDAKERRDAIANESCRGDDDDNVGVALGDFILGNRCAASFGDRSIADRPRKHQCICAAIVMII